MYKTSALDSEQKIDELTHCPPSIQNSPRWYPKTSTLKWLFQLNDSKSLHKNLGVSPFNHPFPKNGWFRGTKHILNTCGFFFRKKNCTFWLSSQHLLAVHWLPDSAGSGKNDQLRDKGVEPGPMIYGPGWMHHPRWVFSLLISKKWVDFLPPRWFLAAVTFSGPRSLEVT